MIPHASRILSLSNCTVIELMIPCSQVPAGSRGSMRGSKLQLTQHAACCMPQMRCYAPGCPPQQAAMSMRLHTCMPP